jgi:hypothetical protein
MPSARRSIRIPLPADLVDRLRETAKAEKATVGQIVVRAVSEDLRCAAKRKRRRFRMT